MGTPDNSLLGNSNTQNIFAQPLLADASLLGSNTTIGIASQISSPLALTNPIIAVPSSPTTPVALQQSPLLFSTSNSLLASSLSITANSIDPLTGNALSKSISSPTPVAASMTAAPPPVPNFSIMADGKVNVNGGGDFDGVPLDLTDDALIYAGNGYEMKGNVILPVQRDAAGNVIKDANNKPLLVTNAVTIGPSAGSTSITPNNVYAGLNPPPTLAGVSITIPTFDSLKQQELATRVPTGTPTVSFNIAQNPIANATQWTQKFPPGGTVTQPKVVQVTGGNLTIPTGVTISNTVIIVNGGSVTLSGTSTLNNVALIVNNGSVNLGSAKTKDTSILALESLTMAGAARFDGKTLIATAKGDLTFAGATKLTDATQDLTVVCQGKITFTGSQNTRGTFLSVGDFTMNGSAQIFGRIKSKGDITFNGNTTVVGIGGFITDTTPPTITAALSQDTAPGGTTNSDKITSNPTITGSVTDVSSIAELKASLNNGTYLDILSQRQANGSFTLSQTLLTQINGGTLPDGVYTLSLQAKDQAGNISNIQYSFTLDRMVTVPTNLDLSASSDSGSSSTDNITKINTPTITGKADAGTTVQLFNGTQSVGQTTANATGDWQIITSALPNGVLNLTAKATDIAGNVSANSTTLVITVDAVQPQLTLTTSTTVPLRDGAKLTGTVNGTGSAIASVSYRFDSGSDRAITPNAAGSFDQAIDFTGITNGNHVLTIVSTDVAGNVTTSTYNVTVALDKDAPVITGNLSTDTGSSNTDRITFNPAIVGIITDFNTVIEFRAGFNSTPVANFVNILPQRQADGSFILTKAELETIYGGALPQGNQTLNLQAKDSLGNLSSVFSIAFTLDSLQPQLTLTTAVNEPLTNEAKLTGSLNGTGSAISTAQYQVDNGTAISLTLNASNQFDQVFNFTGVANGSHVLTITATDVAGNILTTTYNITVAQDLDAPVITAQLVQDSGQSNNDKITFNPNVSGTVLDANSVASFQAAIDNGAFASVLPKRLANGSFTLDRAQLELVNGGALVDGLHTVKLKAVDEFGNASGVVSIVFTLDTTILPPNTLKLATDSDSGVSATDNITKINTPSITGLAEANSTVQLFEGTTLLGTAMTNAAGSWQIMTGVLTSGSHSLTAIATDIAGNISQASTALSITVDTQLPILSLITPVTQPLRDAARLTGSFDGTDSAIATATYRFDNGAEVPVTLNAAGAFDQAINFTGISNGTHTLTLTSSDTAGNVLTQNFNVTVTLDKEAPVIIASLVQDSGSSSTDAITFNPAIAGSLTDFNSVASFRASFGGSFVDILPSRQADGSFSLTRDQLAVINGGTLPDGSYTIQLQAQDSLGNLSSVFNLVFRLDTLAPNPPTLDLPDSSDTGISNSDNLTRINPALIVGTAEAGSTVQVFVDGVAVAPIVANAQGNWQFQTATLTQGAHSITAQATDIAGNTSTLSDPLNLTIDAVPPSLTVNTPLETTALIDGARLVGKANGTGSSIVSAQYRFNQGILVSINPNSSGAFDQAIDFTGISNGAQTLTILLTDAAGNTSSNTYNVTVNLDKTAPIVNVALLQDTGRSQIDHITKNATITGSVSDSNPVAALFASFSATGTYTNITTALTNNSFTLSPAQLGAINGGSLPDGVYTMYFKAQDSLGNLSEAIAFTFTLDTTTPISSGVDLPAASDSGVSNSDNITKLPITLTGTAEVGATVQISANGTVLGTATSDGTWNFNPGNLTDGMQNITAIATDVAGNVSQVGSLNIQIDSVIPNLNVTTVQNNGIVFSNSRLTGQVDGTGTDITQLFYFFDNRVPEPITIGANGNFDTPINFQNITNGVHVLHIVAVDRAGNNRALQYTVTVSLDEVAPLLNIELANDTAPGGTTNTDRITYDATIQGTVTDPSGVSSLQATFGTGANATFVNILPQVGANGQFTLNQAVLNTIYGSALPDGQHTLRVIATDIYDNRREMTLSFKLDRVAPRQPGFTLTPNSDTGILSDGKTELSTVSLVGVTEAGAFVRSLQQPNVTATANPVDSLFIPGRFTLDGISLTPGANALTLEAFDTAGNRSVFTNTISQITDDGGDVVLDWNAITLRAIEFDRTAPPRASYNMALVHAAIFDAVNAIEQDYQRYKIDAPVSVGSSAIAAAAAAAHRILTRLYPLQTATFDAQLSASLAQVADGASEDQGVVLGRYVADAILAARVNDGANAVVSYNPGSNPGDWQPTGNQYIGYAGAALPQWPTVQTFGITSGNQFRPDGPPALTSAQYATELNEVKTLGAKTGSSRTADQTQIAQFWSDGNGTYTPPGHWNEIAEAAALKKGNSLAENARLFALLNISLADSGIAAWDAKYAYANWRPITAIQQADTDNNPATIADPNWQPLLLTPNHPDYVSGHSTFSGAAATVLTSFFGNNYSFSTTTLGLPGVSRTFTSFEAAATEAGVSRIYGGIHTRSANLDGLALGRQVGQYVIDQYLKPIPVATTLQARLNNDTAAQGLTNQDGITNDATITGTIAANAVGNVTLQATFGNTFTNFQNVTAAIQPDGTFTLTQTQLESILGSTLVDGSYTLTLRTTNANGVVLASQAVTFKLDQTAPTVNLQSPLVGAAHSATARAIGQVLDANGADSSAQYSLDGGPLKALPVDAQGKFDQRLLTTNLAAGNHQLVLQTSDIAGNVKVTTVNFTVDPSLIASNAVNAGWVIQTPTGITLAEGSSFTTQAAVTVPLGQASGTRKISFNVNTNFDLQDTNAVIQDRLLVYLVDPQNPSQTLLNHGEAGTAVFSLAGLAAEYTPGLVTFNGSVVTIDVSSLGNRTEGMLVFQLINNDGDTRTTVQIGNLTNVVDPNGVSGTILPPTVQRGNPAGAITDFADYRPTANAKFLVSNVHLDVATGRYVADLQIQNTGNTPLSRNLAVLFPDLPQGVTLVSASGTHPAGAAYLNLANLLPPGDLPPGVISPTVQVVFNNPSLAQFDLAPVVLAGRLDQPPTLASLGNLTVYAGGRLEIPLVATDPDGNRVTLSMRPQENLPTGKLQADGRLIFTPNPDQVGTYTFTLVAKSGNLETTQVVTLNVLDDAPTTTRISGSILNTDQAPLAGVVVGVDGHEVTTDAMGNFTIELDYLPPNNTLKVYGNRLTGSDVYPFIAEKLPLMLEHEVYAGVNNIIARPIYLPPLDVANGQFINFSQDTVVTTPNILGAAVSVKAGTLFDKNGQAFTNKLSITAVPVDLTPAALPDTLHPGLVVTIQPGDMEFRTPAPLTLPNVEGYKPGSDMDLWSINPVTGNFDMVGLGRVSADGTVIETIEGGIRNSSWHLFAPPPPVCDPPSGPDCGCKSCENKAPFTSEVSTQTGGITETHSLVTYESLGESRGVQLVYESLRADARPIIRYPFNGGDSSFSNGIATADLTIRGKDFSYQQPGYAGNAVGLSSGTNFWKLPGGGGAFSVALQADLRDRASGRYDFTSKVGASGSVRVNNTDIFVGSSRIYEGKVINVNTVNSVFGSGWGISGVQEIVENTDGSILLIDGGGSQLIFEKNSQTGEYISAPGDFSKLVKLANGQFQRTDKDQTVYTFDANKHLVSVVDRRGQTTQHVYNAANQLIQIIDPAHLVTTLTYNAAGKVAEIKDPANRSTMLEYDSSGNLTRITDPDGTARNFTYDDGHRMISEVNQRGFEEQDFYNFAGRAIRAIRKDGTEVSLTPSETIGLFRPEQTIDPLNAPLVTTSKLPEAKYIDGNGNIQTSLLDRAGQVISLRDSVGQTVSSVRNTKNLVTQSRNGNGNLTTYEYDDRGNVTKISDILKNPLPVDPQSMRFDPAQRYSLTGPVADLQVADVNSDGNVDLIALTQFGALSISTGSDDGQFTELNTSATNSRGIAIKVGDLNNDGKVDLVVSGVDNATGKAQAQVYLNNGKGGYSLSNAIDLGATTENQDTVASSVTLADLNNDGNLDLVYRQATKLIVRNGRGDGNFSAAFETPIQLDSLDSLSGSGYGADVLTVKQNLTIGDVNGDGAGDVVVLQRNGFSVLLGDRSGRFTVGSNYLLPDPSQTDTPNLGGVKLVDLNKDGKLDLLVSDFTHSSLLTFIGNNSGGFSSPSVTTGMGEAATIQTADLNRDGLIDVIVASRVGDSHVLMGDGNGGYVRQFSTISASNGMAIADVNNDTGLDLITGSGYANVSVGLNALNDKKVSRSYTYDPIFNKVVSETDELGRKTLYELDYAGNVAATTRVMGLLDVTSGETDDLITRYTYLSDGQIDTMTDAMGRVTNYDYNALGRLTKVTYAQGTSDEAVEEYEYDLAGNQTAVIDANRNRTTYEYDAMNRLKKTIMADPDGAGGLTSSVMENTYDLDGNLIETKDARGFVTENVYDRMGRLIESISPDPDGAGALGRSRTKREYDRSGNIVAISDALNRRTEFRYDQRNRLTETIAPDGTSTFTSYDLDNGVTGRINANGKSETTRLDSRGRVIQRTDALQRSTFYEYDDANQMTAMIDPNAVRTEYEYDDMGRRVIVRNNHSQESRTVYDKIGNVIAAITPLQHRTEYRYDNRDRRVAVIDARYTALPVADQKFTSYVYDKVGNMLSITDPVDNTTSYEYDGLNRLVKETNELNKSRTYSYDMNSNRTQAVDRNGRVRTFEYDGWNQLVAEKWLDSSNVATKTIASTYNAGGELTQISDDVSRYSYGYDLRGRLKTVDNTGTPGVAPVKFTYEYDNDGNIGSVTDAIAGITKVTTAYEYDELDRLTQIRQSGVGVSNKRVDMGYDRIGLLKNIDRFTGLDGTGLVATTKYKYDNLNRLEQIQHQNAANTVLEKLDYGYDVDNRITSITDLDSWVNYDYLADNQLIGSDYSDTTPDESYSYDANGNRTNAGYQTGSNNQLSADGAYTYTYDDEGNLLTQTGNGVTRTYVWDYRNRLVGVTDTAGLAVSYGYDVVDQRISKTTSGVTTRYVYDRNHVAMEFENSGTEPSIRYLYGAEVDQILAQDRGNANVSWQMSNQLGSVRLLVGNDGNVRNQYEYDAFGNLTATQLSATDDSRYRYTGREFDAETGLNYYRARYFDSNSGRFIGQDPIGFQAGDTNLYRYVSNNSINAVDPSGKVEISYEFSEVGVRGQHHIDLYVKTRTWQKTFGFDNAKNYYKNNNEDRIVWKEPIPVSYLGKPKRTREQFSKDMQYDMNQRQLIYSDSSDPNCRKEYNFYMLSYFEEMGEQIHNQRYKYNPVGYNSNTAMKAALKRTALKYPQLNIPEPRYSSPGWQYDL